jgi:hypothetical protein
VAYSAVQVYLDAHLRAVRSTLTKHPKWVNKLKYIWLKYRAKKDLKQVYFGKTNGILTNSIHHLVIEYSNLIKYKTYGGEEHFFHKKLTHNLWMEFEDFYLKDGSVSLHIRIGDRQTTYKYHSTVNTTNINLLFHEGDEETEIHGAQFFIKTQTFNQMIESTDELIREILYYRHLQGILEETREVLDI